MSRLEAMSSEFKDVWGRMVTDNDGQTGKSNFKIGALGLSTWAVLPLAVGRERDDEDGEGEGGGEENERGGDERNDDQAIDVEEEATPVRKRKAAAPVWDYGGVKVEGGAKCGICGKFYKTDINNTTNLTGHILAKHKNTEEGRRLKEEVDAKKARAKAKDEIEKKKKENTKKVTQSKIVTFAKKAIPIDPVKKKQIEKAMVEYLVVENQPFEVVEKEAFRKMMHSLDPSFICPSRKTVTKMFDKTAEKVKGSLKEDVKNDLAGLDVKSIHITSDHGTSHDRFRSHKNALTLARCTKDFEIKSDTIAIMKVKGSQTGDRIRSDVKRELDELGREDDWVVNWVTDGEGKQKSARESGRHALVGLKTHHTATCVDHTAHLAVEDALDGRGVLDLKESLNKLRKLVGKMKESHKMHEEFQRVIQDAGDDPLAIIQGSQNRWYFKFLEAERVLLLRPHVERFQDVYEDMPGELVLDKEDWHNVAIYVRSVKTLSDASTLFEGESYPSASLVIPYLDQVMVDLADLVSQLPPEDQPFPQSLLSCLKAGNRFPSGYKMISPYNCLNLLDPNYMDIYLSEEETTQAIQDLVNDEVYDDLVAEEGPVEDTVRPAATAAPQSVDRFALRRAQLLAKKPATVDLPATEASRNVRTRIRQELTGFLRGRNSLVEKTNPLLWWREHASEFPLLARYYKSHCAFPATSTASERVFSCEGLIVTKSR